MTAKEYDKDYNVCSEETVLAGAQDKRRSGERNKHAGDESSQEDETNTIDLGETTTYN